MMARTGGFRGVVPPDNVAGKRESGPPLGGPLSSMSRLVELVRRYSTRSDLHERLTGAARRAAACDAAHQEPLRDSVSGQAGRVWRLHDRLPRHAVSLVIERYQAGETAQAL